MKQSIERSERIKYQGETTEAQAGAVLYDYSERLQKDLPA
jgi:hypothetical protein